MCSRKLGAWSGTEQRGGVEPSPKREGQHGTRSTPIPQHTHTHKVHTLTLSNTDMNTQRYRLHTKINMYKDDVFIIKKIIFFIIYCICSYGSAATEKLNTSSSVPLCVRITSKVKRHKLWGNKKRRNLYDRLFLFWSDIHSSLSHRSIFYRAYV